MFLQPAVMDDVDGRDSKKEKEETEEDEEEEEEQDEKRRRKSSKGSSKSKKKPEDTPTHAKEVWSFISNCYLWNGKKWRVSF